MRPTPRHTFPLARTSNIGAELLKCLVSPLVLTIVVAVAPREFAHSDLVPPVPNDTPMSVVQLYDKDIWRLVRAERDYVLVNLKTGEEGTFSTDGKTITMNWYFRGIDRPVIMNGRALCIKSDVGAMKCMTVWSGPESDDCSYTLIEIKDERQTCLREVPLY